MLHARGGLGLCSRCAWRFCALVLSAICVDASAAAPDRSPIAVAVSPNGRLCISANYTSDSITLVDLRAGQVLAEHLCGRGPVDVAWIDDEMALACLRHEDAIAVIRINGGRISVIKRVAVGDEPRAIAVLRKGSPPRAFVAVSGEDEVAVLDLSKQTVERTIPVGQQPCSIAVTPNGQWLVTACSFAGEVFVHDAASFQLIGRRKLLDETANLGLLAILPDSSACIIPHLVNRSFPVNADNIEKGWVIDNRLSKLPLPKGEEWQQRQMGLDKRGDAVGDAYAAAVSPGGEWLVVTCGGTHELLIFRQPQVPWPPADPGDFIPDSLLADDDRFRRLELGGRPMGVAFIDERHAIVADYLLNALQVVDIAAAKIVRTIYLGQPRQPSLARQGEAIFYDADRSLNSWFSCHTCHTDGHTSGLTFDTLNDRSYNSPKLTPSLRGVVQTAPWTWQGWQTDLHASVKNSLTSTMHSRRAPTAEDANAVVAFLSTLKHFESPHLIQGQLTVEASRGKTLFEGKATCAKCHVPPHFTTSETFAVEPASLSTDMREHNPPSLRGLYARRRFLHDGRAPSLLRVITRHHRPEAVGGEPLSEQEVQDLLAYLKSI